MIGAQISKYLYLIIKNKFNLILKLFITQIVVSVILFAIARFSPYEWRNNRPCNRNPVLLENKWSLSNSCWFSIGYLLRQGNLISHDKKF